MEIFSSDKKIISWYRTEFMTMMNRETSFTTSFNFQTSALNTQGWVMVLGYICPCLKAHCLHNLCCESYPSGPFQLSHIEIFKTPLGLYKASVSLRICSISVRYLAPRDMGRYPLEYVPILLL